MKACLTQSPTEGNPPSGLCADGKILSLYGRGMTTRDIQDQLKDMYGVEVSATLISQVSDAVLIGGKNLAMPLSVCGLSLGLDGCHCRQSQRERARHQQSDSPGAGSQPQRREGTARHVDEP